MVNVGWGENCSTRNAVADIKGILFVLTTDKSKYWCDTVVSSSGAREIVLSRIKHGCSYL